MTRALRVFLCHSSGDKPTVRSLHERLRHDGFEPWLDEVDLLPGEDWELEIQKAIRNANVVLVCLSADSVTRQGYLQKEIRIALDAADQQPEGTVFVIPARLEECDVPERLRRWQWVDLFAEEGYQKLRRSLDARTTPASRRARQRVAADAGAPEERVPARGAVTRSVRYDGLYAQPDEGYTRFIRFFASGKATNASVDGDVSEDPGLAKRVSEWLTEQNLPINGGGPVEILGEAIRWDDVSPSGTIEYRGTISASETELHLHSKSLINGREAYGVWRFVPLPRGAGPPRVDTG